MNARIQFSEDEEQDILSQLQKGPAEMTKKALEAGLTVTEVDPVQRAIDEHLRKADLPGEDYPEMYQREAREMTAVLDAVKSGNFKKADKLMDEMDGHPFAVLFSYLTPVIGEGLEAADGDWLRVWASLGVPKPEGLPDWSAIQSLAVSATNLLSNDIKTLESLLAVSNRRLAPLKDPFSADFGLHRWLCGQREENYSDWLEYAVTQLQTPALVYGLFKLPTPAALEGLKLTTKREDWVEKGDAGHSGRSDLVIRYGAYRPLVIEVKVTGAEEASTLKQSGYAESYGTLDGVLLVTGSQSETSEGGFQVRLWSDVAKGLRQSAAEICGEAVVQAALLLAFAGAIEQNLCGFPAQPLKLLKRGVVLDTERLKSHLDLDEVLST